MEELFMVCASCGARLGRFKRLPRTAHWRDCEIEPIPPVLKLLAGSSQVCTHCGGYMLLRPGAGVLTDRGPLENLVAGYAQGGSLPRGSVPVLSQPIVETLPAEMVKAVTEGGAADAVQDDTRSAGPVRRRAGAREADRSKRDQLHAGKRGDGGTGVRGRMESDQKEV